MPKVKLSRTLIQTQSPTRTRCQNFPQLNITPIPGSVPAVIDYLYREIATEAPFESIMGLSESNVAATFLAEDNGWWEFEGKKIHVQSSSILLSINRLHCPVDGKSFASGGLIGPVRALRLWSDGMIHCCTPAWHWSTCVIRTRRYHLITVKGMKSHADSGRLKGYL